VRQLVLNERGAPVMQRRVHRPVALDVAQRLRCGADRRDRQLDAVVPDVGGPGRGDGRGIRQEETAVRGSNLDALMREFLVQLDFQALDGKIGGDHAAARRLNIFNLNVTGRRWKIRQTSC
jgi:hypothetical protein